MSSSKKLIIKGAFIGVIIGSVITATVFALLPHSITSSDIKPSLPPEKAEKLPLYWVAPMDANYRKDQPGQSPMGMDLVPVYADEEQAEGSADEGAGTIRISSAVENNIGVRIATATFGSLKNKINTVGYVTYDQDTLINVHSRVEGWIEKLYLTSVGAAVKKGDPLYQIYSPELVNAQEELLLVLEQKNSRLIRAAQSRLIALQLPEYAITQLIKTRKVQKNIVFYATKNGVVSELNIREGFYVKPGLTLMSVADVSKVWVEGEVFEHQASLVTVGAKVSVTLDYLPGKIWQSTIDYIYPTLNEKSRTVKVRMRFNNENNQFKPNMFAKLMIDSSSNLLGNSLSKERTLLIPKEALIRTGNQNRVVLALGNGRFKSVAVTIGYFDNNNVEIISGIEAGENVVSSAQFLLDSESSKSSDFKRMNSMDNNNISEVNKHEMSMSEMDRSEMDMPTTNNVTEKIINKATEQVIKHSSRSNHPTHATH